MAGTNYLPSRISAIWAELVRSGWNGELKCCLYHRVVICVKTNQNFTPADRSFQLKCCCGGNPETRITYCICLTLFGQYMNTSDRALGKRLLVPHSAELIASGRVWLLLCHEHTDQLTHWLSSALMTDAHSYIHTHTYTTSPLPPRLIHLVHLRMPLLWCHLQFHYFKAQNQHSNLSLLLLKSPCPLIATPLQKVHTWWRVNYTLYSTIRYSWVSAPWHPLQTLL